MQVRDLVETFPGWVFPDFRLKAILGILLVHSLIHSQLFSPTNHVRNEFASDSWAISQAYLKR